MNNPIAESKTSGKLSQMSERKTLANPVESGGIKQTWLFPAASTDQVESDGVKQTWLFPAATLLQGQQADIQPKTFLDKKHGPLERDSTRLKVRASESYNYEKKSLLLKPEKRKPASTGSESAENKRLRTGCESPDPAANTWTVWRTQDESSYSFKRMGMPSKCVKTNYKPVGYGSERNKRTRSEQELHRRRVKSHEKRKGVSSEQPKHNTGHELQRRGTPAQDMQNDQKPGTSHGEDIAGEILAYKFEAEVLKSQLSSFKIQADRLESERMRHMWEELDKSTTQSQGTESKNCESKRPTEHVRNASRSKVCDVRAKKNERTKKEPHKQTLKGLPKRKMTGTVSDYEKPKKRLRCCKVDESYEHNNTEKKKYQKGKIPINQPSENKVAMNNPKSDPLEDGKTLRQLHVKQIPVTEQPVIEISDDELHVVEISDDELHESENLADKLYEYKVLLLADSRGKDLKAKVEQQLMEQNRDEDVTYVFDTLYVDKPGAHIYNIYKKAEDTLKNNKYDIVYLLAGVNHLIETHENGKVTPLYNDIPTLVDALTDVFASFKNDITQLGHKLSICQLVGLNINQCNGTGGEFQDQQEVINKGVVEFNKKVVKFNIESDVVCPWLLNNVHSLVKGRRINKYKRLPDGINPSEQTQTEWARLIAKATINNCSKFLNEQAEKDLLGEEKVGKQFLEYMFDKPQQNEKHEKEQSKAESTKVEAKNEIIADQQAENRQTKSQPETEKAADKPSEYKVLFLADSTGKDLHANINSQLKMNDDKDITYVFESLCIDEPGVQLSDIYRRAENILRNNKYDMVYVLGGVNHLIETHASGRITPVYTDVPTLVDVLTNQFTSFRDAVNQLGHKVCFCQLSGLDIDKYNGREDEFQWQQMIIDHGVLEFNNVLMYFNMELDCVSPWLETTIHGPSYGRFITKYKKFHDGLNPDPTLQIHWAKLIARSMVRNRTRLPIEVPEINRAKEDMPELETGVNKVCEDSAGNEKGKNEDLEHEGCKNKARKGVMEDEPLEVERTMSGPSEKEQRELGQPCERCKADNSTAKIFVTEDESLENESGENEPPEKEQTEPGPPCEKGDGKPSEIGKADKSTPTDEEAKYALRKGDRHESKAPVKDEAENVDLDDRIVMKQHEYKALLLADSRGKDLNAKINSQLLEMNKDKDITYVFETLCIDEPGARLEDIYRRAEDILRNNKYDMVYVLAGVNHFIETHENGKVTPLYSDVPTLMHVLTDHFTSFKYAVNKLGHKLCFSQVAGLDINHCNGTEGEFEEQQQVLNEAVLELNKVLVKNMNIESDCVGPWLLNTVYGLSKGRRINRYKKFVDGINPGLQTQIDWARLIAKSTINNSIPREAGDNKLPAVKRAQNDMGGMETAVEKVIAVPPGFDKSENEDLVQEGSIDEAKSLIMKDEWLEIQRTGNDLPEKGQADLGQPCEKGDDKPPEIGKPENSTPPNKEADDALNDINRHESETPEEKKSENVDHLGERIMTKQYKALLLADSRGKDMNAKIDQQLWELNMNDDITFIFETLYIQEPGARLEDIYKNAEDILRKNEYDMVYVLAGVNHLIETHASGKVTPLYTDLPTLMDVMTDQFTSFKYAVTQLGHRLCFCQLVGLDINQYNGTEDEFQEQQHLINEGVVAFNEVITSFNMDSNLIPPWLQITVHDLKRCKRVHKYKKLPDGLNPDTRTQKEWAKMFARSAIMNQRISTENCQNEPLDTEAVETVIGKPNEYKALLLSDSRGKELKAMVDNQLLELNKDEHFTYVFDTVCIDEPGARLEDIYKHAEDILKNNKYNIVYVLAGANHLIETHPSGKVTPLYTDVPTLLDVMTDQFASFKNALTRLGHRVCFCQLVGLDVNQLNGTTDEFQDQQQVLNEGVIDFNKVIVAFNIESEVVSPWLLSSVHNLSNGKRSHKYNKLADGINPGIYVQKLWATLFAKATISNCKRILEGGDGNELPEDELSGIKTSDNQQQMEQAVKTLPEIFLQEIQERRAVETEIHVDGPSRQEKVTNTPYEYRVLLLADSRGKGLHHVVGMPLRELNEDENITYVFDVLYIDEPGTRLVDIYRKAQEILKNGKYDIVYLLAGVNNLIKTHENGKVTPLYDDTPTLVDALTKQFASFKHALTQLGHKLCICQLIGIDINQYNRTEGWYQEQQQVINEGVIELNKVIVQFNTDSAVVCPMLLSSVKGSHYEEYEQLLDGINPDIPTQHAWARQFAKATITNCTRFLTTLAVSEQLEMIDTQNQFKALLLADSRGKEVNHMISKQLLEQNRDENIAYVLDTLYVDEPGSQLEDIYRGAEDILKDNKYDIIYLLAGVNNLIETHGNGKVTPLYNDVPTLVDRLTDQFTSVKDAITKLGHKLCICQLVGLDLNQYNGTKGRFKTQQQVINEGVIEFNQVVLKFNTESEVVSPWLLDTVHSLTFGKRYHKYKKLADGMNPGIQTQNDWARLFAKANINNCRVLRGKADNGSPKVERTESGSAGSEQADNRQLERKPAENQPSHIEKYVNVSQAEPVPPQQYKKSGGVPSDRAESGQCGSEEVDNRQSEAGAAENEPSQIDESGNSPTQNEEAENKPSDNVKPETGPTGNGTGINRPYQYKALLLADS